MTTYYVGPGGDDANNGTTWALRKLTLNGAEDIPVVAGDTVYVGPGVYREQLTVDVSGTLGNPITYVGDVTGENTDGVGGIVRITSLDADEQTDNSRSAVASTNKSYRTFRGFLCETLKTCFNVTGTSTGWIIEDCPLRAYVWEDNIIFSGTPNDCVIRRCVGQGSYNIFRWGSSTQDTSGNVVENCVAFGASSALVYNRGIGGVTVRNCTLISSAGTGVKSEILAGVTPMNVNNCLFVSVNNGVTADVLGQLVEDYNTFAWVRTHRTNVNVGDNSTTNFVSIDAFPLLAGYRYGQLFAQLSKWDINSFLTGTGSPSDDFYGITRPAVGKRSWGALQYQPGERETTTTYASSAASIKLADAGVHQIFVPTSSVSTTIECYVYREADYAGTLPQMIVKQPGQADDTTTDTGAAATWNQLTTTLTPAANPGYVVVELRSLNTATSGSYGVYFDALDVA